MTESISKTVTLALEWREDGRAYELYVGPFHVGVAFPADGGWRCRPARDGGIGGKSTGHPTREAAMEALETAVMALGISPWHPIKDAPTNGTPVLVWDGRAVGEDCYSLDPEEPGWRISVRSYMDMPESPK